jgi:hypothetical protein
MSVVVFPTPRWISLTLTFPGLGTVTRDRSIYKSITCSEPIAKRLVERFYAKLADGSALSDTESVPNSLIATSSDLGEETTPLAELSDEDLSIDIPAVGPPANESGELDNQQSEIKMDLTLDPKPIESTYSTVLAAINNCSSVEEVKKFGVSPAKAGSIFDALPLEESALVELIPIKTLETIKNKLAEASRKS